MPIHARVDAHLRQSSVEQIRAARFLNRAFWSIGVVLGAMAASMWIGLLARSAGNLAVARVSAIGVAIEVLALIALFVVLRRRLAAQFARGGEHREMPPAQRDRLAEQNRVLEKQAHTLRAQVAALESQARTQRALADEARLLSRRLVEAQRVAHLGYWETDAATGSLYWSDEMYRLVGLDVGTEPPSREGFLAVVGSEDRDRIQAVLTSAAREMSEFTEQFRLMLPGGQTRTVEAKGRIIGDDRGDRRMVGTVQDVSDRVNLEAQILRAQKMEAIGQLAGGVAHDFNNVLTVIEGYSSLLLAGHTGRDSDYTSLDEIRSAARRAGSLTRQLLAFGRQQVLQPRLLDLNESVSGVEEMLGRVTGDHIELHTKLEPSLDSVRADPGQVEQVLLNLALNARDAMIHGGVLTVETANVPLDNSYTARYPNVRPGQYVMLAVTDTGTGIAPADLDRIFEPFFTTKKAGKGTGLGLSTVHGIVSQSEGHISVYSEPGRGTTFRVYLPRAGGVDAAALTHASAGMSHAGSETILLVEDDTAVRVVASAILRGVGYTIIEAENGLEALRICEDPTASFNLVLSDIVMPGLGGRALAGHVQRIRPTVPVVLMSGYTRESMLHNSELTTASLFIEKPFTPDTLMQKIRDALDQQRAREATA